MSDKKKIAVVPLHIVRAGLEAAVEATPVDEVPRSRPLAARAGGLVEQIGNGLPDGCPVVPLGKGPGACFYLDANKQLMELKAKDHSRLGVQDLFGPKNYLLREFWPRYSRPDADGNYDVTGWRPEDAAEVLMRAAAARGVWNPFEKVRGAGAWRGAAGELVLHCGDAIVRNGQANAPGLIDGFVYHAAEPRPRPFADAVPAGDETTGAGKWLLGLLRTWTWRRAELDPILLLGWIGAAMIGGALAWRPAVWITGGQGTGKSTLHALLRDIFGNALVSVSDTSAAGLWQRLRYDSLPVAIDELEADVDGRRADGVVRLARQASSGGVVLRGGQNHEGAEFVTRSCFLFSSIIMPPLEPQDFCRIAVLEIGALPPGSLLKLDAAKLQECGRKLLRRLVDGWRRFPETLEIYRAALTENGHNARGADQFGTLLACADLTLHDGETAAEYARELAGGLNALELVEWADQLSDESGMIQYLLTSIIEPFRNGTRGTVGDWVLKATGRGNTLDTDEANRVLGTYGLKIERVQNADGGDADYLALANQHGGLAGLFEETKWAGRPGRPGGWIQSARRIEGRIVPKHPLWFGGGNARCTLIPLDKILPAEAGATMAGGRGMIEDGRDNA